MDIAWSPSWEGPALGFSGEQMMPGGASEEVDFGMWLTI